jgi:endonuclease/exonuclease/phosphatase family metal-dependent hydrolase
MTANANNVHGKMRIFRTEIHKARESFGLHAIGMMHVAKAMFGAHVAKPELKLNQAQLKAMATQQGVVEGHLRDWQRARAAAGNPVPDSSDWSVKAAAQKLAHAAHKALSGEGPSGTRSNHGQVRAMTFNIKHASLSDLDKIAEMIHRTKPDMVALQEVDKKTRRSHGIDQAAYIARQVTRLDRLSGDDEHPMEASFQPAMKRDGGQYGVALLSKFPITSSKGIDLPHEKGHEPRVLMNATVNINGKEVPVSVTHLTHLGADERQKQMRKVMQNVSKDGILMGDLNAQLNSPTYNMANEKFHDAWLEAGAPRRHGVDYIFTGDNFIAMNAWVPAAAAGLSDHMPRMTVLKMK